MSDMWEIDLRGQTVDSLDRVDVGPGWYWATLKRADTDPQSGKLETAWDVELPGGRRGTVRDNYNSPAYEHDEQKRINLARRFATWAKRVGLVTAQDNGKVLSLDPSLAVGTRRIICVISEKFTREDGTEGMVSKIPWAAIYTDDRPEIPAEVRVALGLMPLPGQVAPAVSKKPGPKPKVQTAATTLAQPAAAAKHDPLDL